MGSEQGTIELDDLFRPDSKARKVAESLLTGGEMSRQDLSNELGVAVTTINRVVTALESKGATIKRDLNGRQATFQVVAIGPPPVEDPYPRLGATTKIVRAEMLGDEVQVDFVVGSARYRGTLAHLLKGPMPLGLTATVTSVNLESDATATVKLNTSSGELHLGHCRPVTV